MQELIVATKNSGKIKEFKQILERKGYTIKSLLDYPEIEDVVEDGTTFAENALKKARTIAKHFQRGVIADDSGLVVDALNGEPGIYSARYAGEDKCDKRNNEKLLRELEGVPLDKRTASYVCAIALAYPDGEEVVFEGSCYGIIAKEPSGKNGFGYDPLMYIPEMGLTMAELSPQEKNQISHRAMALKKLAEYREEV